MKRVEGTRTVAVLTGLCAALLVGAGSAKADFTFGTPTNLGPVVNSSANDHPGGMSADGLRLYFASRRPGGYSEWVDIWVAARPTKNDPWEEPVNLGPAINTDRSEFELDISLDELILVFTRVETEYPNWGIWMSTRPTRDDPWGQRQNLGPEVNSSAEDMDPSISADGLTLYFNSRRSGGYGETDIYVTTRPTRDDPWGEPFNLGPPVNTSYSDYGPEVSADERTLFFNSRRPCGLGDADLYVTRRPTRNDPWSEPVNLGPVLNTPGVEDYPALSADERLLMFSCSRPGGEGGYDIWQAPLIPVVNFNGDETVDIRDLLVLIESWGQNDPSVDIGPTPLGDGVVDAADLEVFMNHWGQEVNDPTLVGYWKLDESEGTVAYDCACGNDGTVMGIPVWWPDAGRVDGALEFNGATFVVANSVVNPAGGPFSVFAWVKGGAPGQVIVSQRSGANWLMADALDGSLMTDLRAGGRSPVSLGSQTVIADGEWHRAGFTWDGASRRLYVDDVLVAEDTQIALEGCFGNVLIGCGEDMAADTFFSGLIDDVRIYNRAVRP